MHFRMEPGDRLVLVSDGVTEATSEDGQLLGFERVSALAGARVSAAEVADAAQKFGQDDDISVIAVTRTKILAA